VRLRGIILGVEKISNRIQLLFYLPYRGDLFSEKISKESQGASENLRIPKIRKSKLHPLLPEMPPQVVNFPFSTILQVELMSARNPETFRILFEFYSLKSFWLESGNLVVIRRRNVRLRNKNHLYMHNRIFSVFLPPLKFQTCIMLNA